VGKATPLVGAFLLYLALAIVLTFPLVGHLGSVVPLDAGDPVLNIWILGWNATHVPLTAGWWNPPAFYPVGGVLAFSEHLLGLAPLTTPIQWLGGSPLLAYNVAFLLSFPLCAFAAHLLGFSLTGRHDAALVTGLAFGFAPYRIVQLAHIQMLCAYWMPIALVGLHRYARTRRARWLVLFGAAWLLQALTNGYYLLFFSVLVALWLLWFLPPWRETRAFLTSIAAWALAALPLAPLLAGYRAVLQAFDMRRDVGDAEFFSADVLSVLNAPSLLAFWRLPAAARPEGELFPGLAVTICLAAGLAWAWRERRRTRRTAADIQPDSRTMRAVRRVLAAIVVVAALVAASVLIAGPWRVQLLGISLSIRRLDKVLAFACLGLTGLLVTSRTVRDAHRQRSLFGFYALAAGALWVLCLGPSPRVLGAKVLWYKAPYAWLMVLPGFDAVRVPTRFAMLVVLCLAVIAGLVAVRLAPLARPRRRLLIGLLAAGVVADGWIGRMPLVPAPAPAEVLDDEARRSPVLELPVCETSVDMAAEYRTMSGGYPVVNGCSGYRPRHFELLCYALNNHDQQILTALASIPGTLNVIVNREFDTEGGWVRYLSDYPGMHLVRAGERQVLFRLSVEPSRPPAALGPPLPLREIATTPPAADVRRLTDGDRWTSWVAPAPQQGTEEVTIDLGSAQTVRAVRLALGPRILEFPRRLVVEASMDGREWTRAWEGPTAAPAFMAALSDQRLVPLTIDIGDRMARYLRLRQTGRDDSYPWSIAELEVLPAGAGSRP